MRKKSLKKLGGLAFAILLCLLQLLPTISVSADTVTQGRTVRVACGMNDALYLDSNGDPAGICLPYLRQLAWTNNWDLEYVEGSYSEGIQNLYNGKVDLMFPVGKADDTEGTLAFADFIGGYQQIALFTKDDADIYYEDYEGFNHKRVGVSIGSNSQILDRYAAAHGFTYTAVPLNSIQDKIDALESGEVDMISFSTLNTVPNGKLVAVLEQVPFCFCVPASNQELLDELNYGMSYAMTTAPNIASDMFENVLQGYNKISYTKAESDKIKATDQITFGVDNDCLPLAGVDSNGNCIGIYVDLLKAIADESGLNIKAVPIENSNKLYSYLDDGTVDFVIGVQELRFFQENADNHLASNGITEYTTVAVTMPNYQFDSAENPVIALTEDRNYLEDYIYTNYPDATIHYYSSRKTCLDEVQNGNADATFLNTWEYNYETKNPRFQDLMEWENTRMTSVIGLGATKQSDLELLSILEKTTSQLSEEKISDIITANLNIPYQSYTLKDQLYNYKTEILILVFIFIIILGSVSIYLQVKKRYITGLVVANKAKTDFLSRMSHELRTPLNAIDGYASLTHDSLQAGDFDKNELLGNMDSIHNSSEYLLGIIKDILDVQQMETGRITLQKSEINPTEYMHTVVNMIQPLADEKHIQFSYTMIDGANDNYVMDAQRVQQILFSILSNAVKFTPEGGTVTMTSNVVSKDEEFATLQFIIADTGIGMSPDFLEHRLFHRFAQENQDITSPYSGCGNGMAICKELSHLMDGDITCVSEQGKGTTFTVLIKVEHRKQTHQKHERKTHSQYDLQGIHVLMCEDNPMNQNIERHLLERMNSVVTIAADGAIGLETFANSAPGEYSVILMDIRMPNMDGLEATRAIRALDRPDAATIPILAVSANAFEEDIQMSLDAGMNEHLAKPVNGKQLYEKITQYLSQNAAK